MCMHVAKGSLRLPDLTSCWKVDLHVAQRLLSPSDLTRCFHLDVHVAQRLLRLQAAGAQQHVARRLGHLPSLRRLELPFTCLMTALVLETPPAQAGPPVSQSALWRKLCHFDPASIKQLAGRLVLVDKLLASGCACGPQR